ncbi:hypothetical protein H5P27_14545 [Pelagicoccus albus]|uniref:GTPase-associated protein 1 N-terminal domain-containing protein n=1 Tax=Pelagicoccus albus TaxID=415222 RepID=A0A7X1B7V0_9BACT|nr:hypothetical protein [Pelagicoccus albus]
MARDRDLPPDLISELESQSRYTQDSEGGSPLILRHRIVTLRSGTYHILSRIHESGADYSKRNNHLSHHLAFRAEDAIGLPNPAAILLNWRGWRKSWDEPPRILEAFEKFDLQDLESSWAAPQHPRPIEAAADAAGAFTKVYNLSLSEERPLVDHLRRTINSFPADQRWSYSFTSCLLPTDQPQDYVWCGRMSKLPLPYEVDTTSRHILKPSKSSTPATPVADKPEPIATPSAEAKSAPASAMLKKAPTVEIPEEFDHKRVKRPRRPIGQKEVSRSINIAIVGGGLVCIILVLFFVKSQKGSSVAKTRHAETTTHVESLQDRLEAWQSFAEAGYPIEGLPDARETAAFLAKVGEDHPTYVIQFLDSLLVKDSAEFDKGVAVPRRMIKFNGSEVTLPIVQTDYPELRRLAFLPNSLATEIDLWSGQGLLSPVSAMPNTSFSIESFQGSLQAFALNADSDYQRLADETLQVLRDYDEKRLSIVENKRFEEVLELYRVFDQPDLRSYLPFDESGLLLLDQQPSLADYLKDLISKHLARYSDPKLDPDAFLAAYAHLGGNTPESPLEVATALYQAMGKLQPTSRTAASHWKNIRIRWQYAFIRSDLMEQTILGYTLEGLEREKAALTSLRQQFTKDQFQLHVESRNRIQRIAELTEQSHYAVSEKDWIVISKQSPNFRSDLP